MRARQPQVMQTDFRAEETGGFCVNCNQIVPRDKDARCAVAGHPPERVSGLVVLRPDGSVPFQAPKFSWGAALMPPVWGPIHGVYMLVIFLPVIVFANRSLQNLIELSEGASTAVQVLVTLITVGIVLATLYAMYYFGKKGWGIAWRSSQISRVPGATEEMFKQFIKRERWWTLLSVVLFAGFVFLVANFWL